MNQAKRLTATSLLLGFALILGIAASAQPLRAENATASAKPAAASHHFLGKVSGVNDGNKAFTLDSGSRKVVVATDSSTKFFNFSGGKKSAATFADIKVDARVAAIGPVEGSTLTAKIVAILPVKEAKRQGDSGRVTAVSSGVITYLSVAQKNTSARVFITSSTVFTKKVAGKIEKVSASAVAVGDKISFHGPVDDNGVITARLVHIIPGNPTASSSAK